MLKKRILASSLASVMALSSVSVVAFADETATAKYNEAITKPELKELLAEIEKDVDKGVYDEYGTKYGEIFTKAFEAAKLAVEDGSEDYIIASYQVLQSVLAKKQDVDIDALKQLVSDLKGKYNKGNIINDEFTEDYYYEADTWAEFVNAYEAAEVACESDNKTEICDAYFTLLDADDGLKSTNPISKSEFTRAYKAYREVIEQKYQYENWRRGKATESVTSGIETGTPDFKNDVITYGDLFEIITGTANAEVLDGTKPQTGETWIAFDATLEGTTSGKKLEESIDYFYAKFMGLKTATQTACASIVEAYNACKDAVRVFNGWKVDSVRRGSKAQFEALVRAKANILWTLDIDKNGTPDALGDSHDAAIFTASGVDSNLSFSIDGSKIFLNNAGSSDITIYLDPNGKLQFNDSTGALINTSNTNKTIVVEKNNGQKEVTSMMPEFNLLTAGTSYLGYLDSKCQDGGNGWVTLTDALQAKANIDKVAADDTDATKDYSLNFDDDAASAPAIVDVGLSYDYNNIKAVTAKSNSAAAYSLAYRILEYALNDIIPTPAAQYKKADVKAYVAKANTLLEQAEKSATFATEAAAVADALAATAEWLAEASKKDYVEYGEVNYTPTMTYGDIDNGATSTEVWEEIDGVYTALADKLAEYPYSYEEISATIAKAAEGIDAGVYGKSVADLVKKVAYDLVTAKTVAANKNNPYDEDTFAFIQFNRVNKDGTDSEKDLVADYDALLKAMKEGGSTGVKGDLTGDNKVNINDAVQLLKEIASGKEFTAEEIAVRDLNGDKNVNVLDAVEILKIIAKG